MPTVPDALARKSPAKKSESVQLGIPFGSSLHPPVMYAIETLVYTSVLGTMTVTLCDQIDPYGPAAFDVSSHS